MRFSTALAYAAAQTARVCVAALLIWKGHSIAACIMVVLVSPSLETKSEGGAK